MKNVLTKNLHMKPSYLPNLARLGIASFLNLVWPLLGEGNAEHSQGIVVSSLDINMSFNKRLPLPNQRSKLVCGKIHTLQRESEMRITKHIRE